MRRASLIVLLTLAFCIPGWSTITAVTGFPQGANTNCSSSTTTSCNLTVSPAIPSGASFVVVIATTALGASAISDNQADTFVGPADCIATQTAAIVMSCYYVLAAKGSVTSITSTVTTGDGRGIGAMAFTTTASGMQFVAAGNAPTGSCSASPCSGIALTLTGSANAIVQATVNATVTSISGGYSTPFAFGGASRLLSYLINTASGAAPLWTITGSVVTVPFNGIALQEVPASFVANQSIFVVGP